MTTQQPLAENRTLRTPAVFIASLAITLALNSLAAPGSKSAGGQDIKATITLDRQHTSIVDRQTTEEGLNEFRGDTDDALVNYINGNRILAQVGRNRHISFDGNTSSSLSSGRTVTLDLAGALGCAGSRNVDSQSDGICDGCVDTTPLLPDSRFGVVDDDDVAGQPDNFDFIIVGEDYDDLVVGCTVQTWARLMFDIGDENWFLIWGRYKAGGGANLNSPDASPVEATRASPSEWRFQTTGNHLAALYRSYANDGLGDREYHGQFRIKFSGTAVSLPNQALPAGSHCDVQVVPVDACATP